VSSFNTVYSVQPGYKHSALHMTLNARLLTREATDNVPRL
jgi:hypothetical protein